MEIILWFFERIWWFFKRDYFGFFKRIFSLLVRTRFDLRFLERDFLIKCEIFAAFSSEIFAVFSIEILRFSSKMILCFYCFFNLTYRVADNFGGAWLSRAQPSS